MSYTRICITHWRSYAYIHMYTNAHALRITCVTIHSSFLPHAGLLSGTRHPIGQSVRFDAEYGFDLPPPPIWSLCRDLEYKSFAQTCSPPSMFYPMVLCGGQYHIQLCSVVLYWTQYCAGTFSKSLSHKFIIAHRHRCRILWWSHRHIGYIWTLEGEFIEYSQV